MIGRLRAGSKQVSLGLTAVFAGKKNCIKAPNAGETFDRHRAYTGEFADIFSGCRQYFWQGTLLGTGHRVCIPYIITIWNR